MSLLIAGNFTPARRGRLEACAPRRNAQPARAPHVQRASVPVDETDAYLNVLPTTSQVAVEAAGAWAIDYAEGQAAEAEEEEARARGDAA